MPRLYLYGEDTYRTLTLIEAVQQGYEWDVFVSHKSDDEDKAVEVAKCIQTYGKQYELSAWVDVLDPNIHGDGPDLDRYIERVLVRSFSLLAVVSDTTHQSWWVPFEIGVSFELRKYMASYVERPIELPSFLQKHPRVADHDSLHKWCDKIGELKRKPKPDTVYVDERLFTKVHTKSTYISEMRAMADTFR